jgi:hypothetical protein
MKVRLCLAIALVMVAATLSCGLLDLPQACYEGDLNLPPEIPQEIQDFIADLVACEEGKVCNSAISVLEQCESILGLIEEWIGIELPDRFNPCERIGSIVLRHGHLPILDEIGTCQDPGEPGFPCGEDADCASLSCGVAVAGECD